MSTPPDTTHPWTVRPNPIGVGQALPPYQTSTYVTQWPTTRAQLTCACGKPCTYERIAKDTKTLESGQIIIKAEATALVCPAHGIIAWA